MYVYVHIYLCVWYVYIYSDKNYFVSQELTYYSFAQAAHQGT